MASTDRLHPRAAWQDCSGVKRRLIKDWKEVVTRVGDNQSLLQSLKDSPYYAGMAGEDSSRIRGKFVHI